MEVLLNELVAGKATVIRGKDYLSTREYVQPFIDEMSKITTDFKIQVRLPDQMTVGDTTDTTYNRVLIEAILGDNNTVEGHKEVVALLYGLDTRKPVAKIYRGYQNAACLNLTVFDSKWLELDELRPGEAIRLSPKKLMALPSNFDMKLKGLKNKFLTQEEVKDKLGTWVDMCLRNSIDNGIHRVKMSPLTPIEAYKSLYIDVDSPYFVKPEAETPAFNVYNALTQVITDDDRDFVNKFEKTMMVNKLIGELV